MKIPSAVPEAQWNVVWAPSSKGRHGSSCVVEWEVLMKPANRVYYVPGTSLGPGNAAVSNKYVVFAITVLTHVATGETYLMHTQ